MARRQLTPRGDVWWYEAIFGTMECWCSCSGWFTVVTACIGCYWPLAARGASDDMVLHTGWTHEDWNYCPLLVLQVP